MLPADDRRLPRRARDAPAADPGDVRAQYEKPPPLVAPLALRDPGDGTARRGGRTDQEAVRDAAERAHDAGVLRSRSASCTPTRPDHERRAAASCGVVGDGSITCSSEIWPRSASTAHEHGRRQRIGGRPAVHPLARVEPGRGRGLGSAPDHAVERRPDERRVRDPEAGAPGRIGACGRCRRLRLPRTRDGHPERDLARHGRDDREGRDPRGWSAGQDLGVRGRRRDQPQQPADQGRRPRHPAPVHRSLGDRPGGGSLVSVDEFGMLRVGPESAGADPGPACYGLGSDAPT